MLVLNPKQIQLFDAKIKAQFVEKLTGQLSQEYPEIFQPLPQALALRMVAKKIAYAQFQYQILYQNALTTYLHYCCAIGPGFDLQPEIQNALYDLSRYPDDIPDQLPDLVSAEAWEAAEQQSRQSDWFNTDPESLPDHIAAHLCWAMAALAKTQKKANTTPEDAALTLFINQSMQLARKYQIIDAKGMTAFGICQILLGTDFYLQTSKPWIAPIFHDPAILPMLRGATLAGCVELEWELVL